MNRVQLLSGVLGGLVVLVLGAVLIATNVIDTGDTTREVVQAPISRPASNTGASSGRTVADIYKQEGKGVVFVQARGVTSDSGPFGLPGTQRGTATGSGFVVDKDGTILTNAHVVDGASSVTVSFNEDGSDSIPAEVKGRDVSADLAVLKVDPDKVKAVLPLGDSSKAQVGDPVVAIGNPFGFTRTVTTGIVSALQRQIEAPNGFSIPNVIQTDAAINPGNSGGPLLDANGRVIGINSQIATGGSGNGSVGIGFAIPINTAKKLLPQLEKGEKIERAYLGIEMTGVDSQLANDLNLPTDHGALIQTVVSGGPADKAGLRGGNTQTSEGIRLGGDLIVKVGDRDIRSPDDVTAAIASKKPGDKVQIEYYRRGDKKTTEVTLGKRPSRLQSSQQDQGGNTFPFP